MAGRRVRPKPVRVDSGKWCKNCLELPFAPTLKSERVEGVEYRPTKRRPTPFPGPRCASHNRATRRKNSSARKKVHVETTYGITEEQYWELYDYQGGKCYICRRVEGQNRDASNGRRKRLSVDHDHACCNGPKSCGKCVRGLACTTCNKFLGHIRDSPAAMQRGADYLTDPPANYVLGNTRGAKYHGDPGRLAG